MAFHDDLEGKAPIRTIIPARGRKLMAWATHVLQWLLIRTIIPARGRKRAGTCPEVFRMNDDDKNHNPRKGTETSSSAVILYEEGHDKNHNPRKGTETLASL